MKLPPLTLILVKDKSGGYTSFFKQFSNIISQGETEKEAIDNLIKTVYDVFLYKNKNISNLDSRIIQKTIYFSSI